MSAKSDTSEPHYLVENSLFFDTPLYFDILSDDDKRGYIDLKKILSDYKFCKSVDRKISFVNQLKHVQKYVERNDSDDWKRGLVCGIIFLENSVAINIQQLIKIFSKCKSSINNLFQKIGFFAHRQGSGIEDELINKFPFSYQEKCSAKNWTVRDCVAGKNPFRDVGSHITNNSAYKNDLINVGTVAIEPRRVINMFVPVKFRYKLLVNNRSIAIQT